MRYILVIFLIVLDQLTVEAQYSQPTDQKLDSLKEQFKSSVDTVRAEAILAFGNGSISKAWNATNTGEFALAFETFGAAMEVFESPSVQQFLTTSDLPARYQNRYWRVLANIYFNYGLLMSATGSRESRIRYNQKTYEIAKQHKDTVHLVYTNGSMAILYVLESKPDSALFAIERALSYDPASYNYNSYSMLWYLRGSAKLMSGEPDEALNSFRRGIKWARVDEFNIHLMINYLGMSKSYRALNVPDSCYYYGIEALDMMKEIKEVKMLELDLSDAYGNLYQYFQKFGEPDSAIKYLQLARDTSDYFSRKTIKNLAAFQEVLLEKQLKLKDLEKAQIERQSQNRTLLFGGAVLVFIVVGGTLFYNNRQKVKANKLLAAQKQEIQSTLDKLKSTQAQLIQSEKMASLGELTAGIAHEIQNPLNFVNNFSDVSQELIDEMAEEITKGDLEEVKELSKDIRGNLEKITHHGKRADAIVKGMLAHSRAGKGENVPTDINALAEEYLKLSYHGLCAKDKSFNADFKTDFDPNLPKVNVVPQDIGRVLLNLINNAFQAVSERSKKEEPSFKPTVSVKTQLTTNDQILITIKDNGPGIPDDIKDKIFQPFFTTKPTGQGTGLGLSLSYDIVKALGGELHLETTNGNGLPAGQAGTTFTISIPTAN